MYRVNITDHFSSAHQLRGYKGKCEELHGHNWKVKVEVEGKKLNETGLLIDFKDLKQITKNILTRLDHRLLNDIDPFKDKNPSSEFIAEYLFSEIKIALPPSVNLISVSVWESENSYAVYFE